MQQSRTPFFAKCAAILIGVPILVLSYASGPPERRTGAPGDSTCAESGCHTGTAVNASGNQIEVTFAEGSRYTPGQRQRITVRITDPRTVHGFQMSSRLASNERNGQAGTFSNVQGTIIICEDGRTRSADGTCPATAPLEFIEHSQPNPTNTFQVDWTAPATNVGDVRFFVAANAANGNGQNTGDRIYTANFTLSPAAAGGERPAISQGGVVDAFIRQPGLASGTWIEIYGQNLAPTQRDWTGAPEFTEGRLPTTLNGVSVTVNNRPAAISFISSGQVNALIPADEATGDVAVVVTTAAGASAPITIRKAAISPAPYAPFRQNDRAFVTLVENSSGAILGKPGVEPRAARAARPGDVVQLYALGLGATNPALVTDRLLTSPAALVNSPVVRINDVQAEVLGAALVSPGLYQINLRVPEVPNGDHPFVLDVAGSRSPTNVFITIQR